MITFSKQENGVLFTFENSDKYLYGDGTILVPFNSLAVIQDESDMITLRKSASWDIFLSGRFDTDFNYGSKEDAVDALKEALFDESGGGVTEEEVEQMIDAATSGIPSSQVVEQLRTDVNTISGTVSSHTANTEVHVTQAEKNTWNGKVDEGYVTDYAYSKNQIDGFLENATTLLQTISGEVDTKQDILTAGANITISGNVISAEAGNNIIELTQEEYDALTEKDPDALYIITDAQEINMNDYYTKSEVDASIATKADTSALTAVQDSLSGYVTTTTYESGQYATAQALNALQENKLDASAYTPTDLSEYWTSGQTQNAINAATSGKADTSAVTAVNGALTTHTANTTVHVSQAEKATWNAKADASAITSIESSITAVSNDLNTLSGAVIDNEYTVSQAINELKSTKQDTLASGTNIKTINGESILGEGNITIEGGGGGMDDDTQQLISTALNDLNDRKADLTELTKYQKKGDYVVTSTLADYMTNDAFDEYATAKERIISGALNDLNDKFGGLRLVKISQSDYDQLATKDSSTLYIISD